MKLGKLVANCRVVVLMPLQTEMQCLVAKPWAVSLEVIAEIQSMTFVRPCHGEKSWHVSHSSHSDEGQYVALEAEQGEEG